MEPFTWRHSFSETTGTDAALRARCISGRDGLPLLDTFIDLDVPGGFRRLYLGRLMAENVAHALGWSSPVEVEALEGALLDAHARIEELEDESQSLRESQTVVVSLDDVRGALWTGPEAA